VGYITLIQVVGCKNSGGIDDRQSIPPGLARLPPSGFFYSTKVISLSPIVSEL